jgi:hypothetical protein
MYNRNGNYGHGNDDFTATLFAVMSEYQRDLRDLPPVDAYEIARLETLERLDEQLYDRRRPECLA